MKLRRRGRRLLDLPSLARLTLLAAALFVAASALVLAVAHLDDRFGVDHVSGAWLGLAAAARDGVLYPPLAEDGYYAGTRWLPLPFLLYAAADAVTGDLLTGAKLVTYAAASAVLALVALACRRRGAPWSAASALTAAVAASWAGTTVFLGVRGDAVSLALGLAAVAVLERRQTGRRAAAAGVLCALALVAKLTALWAPAALVVWLLVRGSRRLAGVTAAVFAGTALLLLVALDLLSAGRMHDNLSRLAFAGSDGGRGAFGGVRTFYDLAIRDQRSAWPLLLVGAATAVLAVARRRAGPHELAFGAALAILLVVLRDTGARENHLLDVTALAAIVSAGAWGERLVPARLTTAARVVVGAAAVAAVVAAGRHTLLPPVRDVVEGTERRLEARSLVGLVTAGDCQVSQDPTLPLLLGQRPVVLDPFMLPRLDDDERYSRELARRIRERRFDRIVLFVRPDEDPFHFRRYDFGSAVADAIEDSYRLLATVSTSPPSYVYAPEPGGGTRCEPRGLDDWSS